MSERKRRRLTPGERNNLAKVLLERIYPILDKQRMDADAQFHLQFEQVANEDEKALIEQFTEVQQAYRELEERKKFVEQRINELIPRSPNYYGRRFSWDDNDAIKRMQREITAGYIHVPSLRNQRDMQDDLAATMLVFENDCANLMELINKTLERFGFNFSHVADLFPSAVEPTDTPDKNA